MKFISMFAFLVGFLLHNSAHAAGSLPCEEQVTGAIQGSEMFDVVEQVHSTDGVHYVVVFRTASGDAEQASVAVVGVNPETCQIQYLQYVRGSH